MDKTNDDIIWVKKRKLAASYSMSSSHCHQYNEIFYIKSGECSLFMQHSIYRLRAGDMAIISTGTIHKTTYLSTCEHERIVLDFKDEHIKEITDRYGENIFNELLGKKVLSFTSKQKKYLEDLLDKMILELEQPDNFSDAFLNTYLVEFILFLIRYQSRTTHIYKTMDLENESIQRAADYIFHNYDKPITLTEMANMLHLNRTYFSKKFKQATGIGFKEYLTRIRIRRAEQLLLESNMSITEIAFACGFTDSNYFGDAFRHINGVSPLAYRKNNHPF